MPQDPWSGFLNPDEQILWQGRPDGRVVLTALRPMAMVVGLIFAGAGLFVSGSGIVALTDGLGGAVLPVIFGLCFAAIGLRLALGDLVVDAYTRANSWYTLTNQRMIVATDTFGRKRIRDLAITADTPLVYEDGPPGSLTVSGRKAVGFRRIEDARKVYDLARQVQRADLRAAKHDQDDSRA